MSEGHGKETPQAPVERGDLIVYKPGARSDSQYDVGYVKFAEGRYVHLVDDRIVHWRDVVKQGVYNENAE